MEGKKLKATDIKLLDDVFAMHGGYVLDFSNQSFADFFADEFGVDIYSPVYAEGGGSKAKRLRYYLRHAPITDVIKALLALWDYREVSRRRSGEEEKIPHAKADFCTLITSLGGVLPDEPASEAGKPKQSSLDASIAKQLLDRLMAVSVLEPQPRGYAFEGFLKELFDANGLAGRSSFRLVGEQIDGSFEMNGETYLLEAKWTNLPVSAADLRSFNAKVEDKASWSRGLFVSNSGFSEEGLVAFGRGKSLVCMDGLDLFEMLQGKLTFADVLARKVRKAAETGRPFVRLRELQ
jgi:hypothetical protein